MKLIVFYHCFLFGGDPPDLHPGAFVVVNHQMNRLTASGLAESASEIIVGINGGQESLETARLIVPQKAKIVLHGLESKCENPTLVLLEDWLKANPEEALVLYFHAKGSSWDLASEYGKFETRWRDCMMAWCVDNWGVCVNDLMVYEAVGCHWLTGMGSDHSQNYFAGTFFWARASFLRTLPSILRRERIKMSGLGSADSRWEAEVWVGNGPRLPHVKDYHPGWPPAKHDWPPRKMV